MTEHDELEMWKSMYLHLLRGTENAIKILTESEQAAEALYINSNPKAEPPEN